jgi:L-alanine-DL-glutamate epimerase-like enolase superfamily enzyme
MVTIFGHRPMQRADGPTMPVILSQRTEFWPISGRFVISRGAKTQAAVVVAELADGPLRGRGECVPYARYGESVADVVAAIEGMRGAVADGLDRAGLQQALPAGAARNALDCAFWDLESKRAARPAYALAGLGAPRPLVTAYTISLGQPDDMARAAAAARRPMLKLKLGAPGDRERLAAVRRAVPEAELIADANEGWNPENLEDNLAACAEARVALVEQPLPADNDDLLRTCRRPVPVCADESVHDCASLPALAGKYDAVNIKLDKAGGLTEALALVDAAEREGFIVMVGCMVATSLAMAPAVLLAQRARFVDLDGPLLLAKDRADALRYEGNLVHPPSPALWG